ncbi:MAG: endonuclease/exonuclease/phosphatase family protein [Pseudomonadota bacterium]
MSFLQIASWNVEHLSGNRRGADNQSAYALADHIEMAGVDIVALQEIYVTDEHEEVRLFDHQPVIASAALTGRRNRDLDIVCYLLEEHLGDAWRYQILPNRNLGDTEQLCAVMWNTTRVERGEVVRLDVVFNDDGDWLWDRAPHAIQFTTTIRVWERAADGQSVQEDQQRSIVLVPLHMKSNFGGGAANPRKRSKEAKTLCEHLPWVEANMDPSVILIGDTNIKENTEAAIDHFIDAGYVDLNSADRSTYWSHRYGHSPFDRVFVKQGRREFQYTRQYILQSADLDAHDRELSDHYMIKISVKSYVDDADPRKP